MNQTSPKAWRYTRLENIVSKSHTGLVRSAREQNNEYPYAYVKMNNLSFQGKLNLDQTSLPFLSVNRN